MTGEEANQFVAIVSDAWQPPLTDTQKGIWRDTALPQDPHVAFAVIMKLTKSEARRPALIDYRADYRRGYKDTTPVFTPPIAREDLPHWVRGWDAARAAGDMRPWPEQKPGYAELGYVWNENDVMPQEDRVKYMREAGVEV